MLDTLRAVSPPVPEAVATDVERQLLTTCRIDNATGDLHWEIVSGPLEGSYDNRISVMVRRREWIPLPQRIGPPRVELMPCKPRLVVEGSVHKAMLGHNVDGGPLLPSAAASWFIAETMRVLRVDAALLSPPSAWEVERVDWSQVFDLGSYEECEDYIHALKLGRYARRKSCSYGDQTVFMPGTTTTWKLYHKGPEFAKNGHRCVSKCFGAQYAKDVQERANRYLRVECSVKKKKLKVDFGKIPVIGAFTVQYLEQVHDAETGRVLREGAQGMETVREAVQVKRRLFALVSDRKAAALYGTWLQLATLGEDEARRTMTKPTFYRHRKELVDCGVSWQGTDVHLGQALIRTPFSLRSDSPLRVRGESPRVELLQRPYIAA